MKQLLFIILILTGLGIFQGCYYDVEEELYPVDVNACDTSNVTYNATVKPLMDSYCMSCHSQAEGQGGVVLETYTQVKDYAISGSLIGAIKHQTGYSAMPQGGAKLSDCNIAKIEKWAANQYPEN